MGGPRAGEVGAVVRIPGGPVRLLVEGVGVRVDADVAELQAHQALDHVGQVVVLGGDRQVWPHLGGGVAQPHGGDVAGQQEGRAVGVAVHGGGERVGERGVEVLGPVGVFGAAQLGDAVHETADGVRHGLVRHDAPSHICKLY